MAGGESRRTARRAPAPRRRSTRTSTAPDEEGAVTSLVEPARAPDLTPQRERLPELDSDHGPRLGVPARVQHHAQDAVDAELACSRESAAIISDPLSAAVWLPIVDPLFHGSFGHRLARNSFDPYWVLATAIRVSPPHGEVIPSVETNSDLVLEALIFLHYHPSRTP
jgi:hypothetical protein